MSCSVVEGVAGEGSDLSTIAGLWDMVWGIATGFIPSLAAWEGCGALFSSRKRKHYSNMVMAIVPMNKNMEFGDAISSLGSGLGLSHSSDNSKIAFEEDEEDKELE